MQTYAIYIISALFLVCPFVCLFVRPCVSVRIFGIFSISSCFDFCHFASFRVILDNFESFWSFGYLIHGLFFNKIEHFEFFVLKKIFSTWGLLTQKLKTIWNLWSSRVFGTLGYLELQNFCNFLSILDRKMAAEGGHYGSM